MFKQVLNTIIQEVIASRYFSISVDSTPDISHIDQLSFCILYVNNKGEPVVRFLCFLDQIGHKAEDLENAIFSVLKKYDLILIIFEANPMTMPVICREFMLDCKQKIKKSIP